MSTTAESGTAGAATTQARMSRREVLQALSGLMLGIFVSILAATVVSNALPVIIADLNGSQSIYTWVVTAELLAMTASVPLWGKLADLVSQKLLVQLSLALFVAGSLLAGFSQDTGTLIVARVIQGLGAGGLTALVQIVMAAMIPPRELGRYAGVFGAVFAVATVAGPLIGGVIVDTSWLGWRWCFFMGAPFALVAIVLLQKTLKLTQVRRGGVHIDWLGALLITAGVSTLLIWVTLAGNEFDWASGTTALMVGGAVVLLALAVLVESRSPEPVIPLDIFRNRTVTLTTLASALVGIAMFGGTVFLSQYFQISLGYSPTEAGLLSLPMIAGLLVSSTVAGALITKTGTWKRFLVAGGVLMTVGFGLLATIDAQTSIWVLGAYMVVLGVGVGLLMQNLVLAAQNDVPARELGSATSVLSFFRSLGGTVGVSVLGAVLASRVAGDLSVLGGGAAEGGTTVPDVSSLPPEIAGLVQDAYGNATAELFLIATPLAALALLVVLFIKEKPLKTTSGAERLAEEQAQLPLAH
ncbi:MDR family MFS transporter [Geodermatophilus sabuli]|uniref:Drug resistance transporter, EmrB/QacA subfamily n=1 Tax=Geodermatophilus sabuli TaxID=1564158 RepID=A0A285EFR7_9ACTN|nr:MDR family MFS transporter [Geodermatophilus sabuli]MBB3082972.1 EmrB/QacA subfamily drug resistance transporter [Geodermatophilus sabuli]SNX97969.1 drug resistance transporter, EmrB/QacA subfamily [Geodermatophilus sabuli]